METTTKGAEVKRYEVNLIADAHRIGLDVDPQHVAGNPEILWEIRRNIRAIEDMPRTQREAAVARVNGGYPLRLSDALSQK